jgi:hypothetical protein
METFTTTVQYPRKKLHDLHWLSGSFRLSGLLKHCSKQHVKCNLLLLSCGACTRPLIKTFSPELDNPCSRVEQGFTEV